jgi:Right handed beta helix region
MTAMVLRITFLLLLLARGAAAASHADLFVDLNLPARLPAGQPILFGGVRNNGPDAAENVTITATTSNGQRFDIPIGTVYPTAGLPFTLTFPGQNADFRLDVRVSSTTPDPDSANDTASGPVHVTDAPELTLWFDYPTADPGQAVVYETRIANMGINDAAHVAFTIPLDDDWTFGESLTPRLQCTSTLDQARCTIDTLAAGEVFVGRFTLLAPQHRDGEPLRSAAIPITSDRGVFDPSQSQAFLARSIYRHVVVTNTADDGEGSLRQAIDAANATTKVGCKIDFDIAIGGGERVATIRPLTPLPLLAASTLFVDGSTQRAAHGDTNPDGPEIEINGANVTGGSGLESSAGFIELRELVVNGFPGNGINIRSGYGRIIGCYVGSDTTGRRAIPNGERGVVVSAAAEIRDNVISGNTRSGIFVASGQGIAIANNRIGVGAGDELLPLGNGASGIYFGPQSAESAATGNVIGFNRDAGIGLDSNATDITMSANANASNGGLPIDYGIDGVTPNGPPFHDFPAFPVLTAAHFDPATGKTVVDGQAGVSFIGADDRVEFFGSESAEPRQAAQFLGRLPIAGSSSKQFHFEYYGDLRGRFITATYTTPGSYYPEVLGSRTSELSAPAGVEGEPTAPLPRIPRGADLALQFGGDFQTSLLDPGQTTAINFSYRNLGPEEARDVVLTIDIQGAAAVRLDDPTGDSACRLAGSERIVCSQQSLAAGVDFLSVFSVQAPLEAATINLSASLTSSTDDPDRSNNAGQIAIQVNDAPSLSLSTQAPGPTEPGAGAVYVVSVHNFALPANDVTLTIPLRTGWTFVGADGGGWQCSADAAAVVCKLATLTGDVQFNLTLRAPQITEGQPAGVSVIHVTASRPLAFDPQAFLVTKVVRLYSVTSSGDAGSGSLRDVITRANTECPPQAMTCRAVFNLPPPVPTEGYFSIRPRTPLPAITSALIIDASTQSDATGDSNPLGPEVELNGSDTTTGNGIIIHTSEAAGVRGLAINRFPENGIAVDELSNGYDGLRRVIADCYIGTDPTGRTAAPNGLRGIGVQVPSGYGAALNIVGNVISGNAHSGIFIAGGSDVHISDNRVGVAAGEGMAPLGNGASGIYLGSATNVTVDRNVIAFNRDVGIGCDNAATWIGMQRNALFANGHLAIDYGLDGVTFNDSASRTSFLPQFPLITSAVSDQASGVTRIEGIAPPSSFLSDRGSVDLYRDSAADPSGFGPAEEWIGEVVLEFSTEPRPFVLTVPRNLQGNFIAATFTRITPTRWTSELSATIPVTSSP